MKEYTIGLGIARINGIEKNPYYFEQKNILLGKLVLQRYQRYG